VNTGHKSDFPLASPEPREFSNVYERLASRYEAKGRREDTDDMETTYSTLPMCVFVNLKSRHRFNIYKYPIRVRLWIRGERRRSSRGSAVRSTAPIFYVDESNSETLCSRSSSHQRMNGCECKLVLMDR